MRRTSSLHKSERSLFDTLDFSRKHTIQDFFDFDITVWKKLLETRDEAFWETLGRKRVLGLFHAAAERVPAYAHFLKRHKIVHKHIKTFDDFTSAVPLTDKKNYIGVYPIEERCWDGKLNTSHIMAISSGTTGEPRFWPRGSFQEFEAAIIHELIYNCFFKMDHYETLLLIGFPMGVYVSGVATLLPSLWIREKGYPCTIISTSNQKGEMLRALKHLQKKYQQVVLVGHPFFVKDVIETGKEQGIDWSARRLKIMFCSEGFSESWRKYVIAETGIPADSRSVISTYGSSEMLIMAHETPMSIAVRGIAEEKTFDQELFGSAITNGLFQYNPFFRYIETIKNELIFTSASGTPLMRFNLHDTGRVISFLMMRETLDKVRPGWQKELGNKDREAIWRLPFVVLGNRSDMTVVFYAANIYPEHIRAALQHPPFLKKLTGKFVMQKGYLRNMDEFLEVHIELRDKMRAGENLKRALEHHLVKKLKEVNLEYADASARLDKDLRPRVILRSYQHEKYFRPGLKPKYIAQ